MRFTQGLLVIWEMRSNFSVHFRRLHDTNIFRTQKITFHHIPMSAMSVMSAILSH